MKARHGFICGKFYPPHAGHHSLVSEAAKQCERLTVAVLAASVESIPLEKRVAWMREAHQADFNVTIEGAMDDHEIDFEDEAIWDAHFQIMRGLTSEPVDVVFSSEKYGEKLAELFGAKHVCVDLDRNIVPISGTKVRENIPGAWPFLSAAVRAGLCKRVVIVGAESTGKTTLASELAAEFHTQWVPEYGREFAEQKMAGGASIDSLTWEPQEFVSIARVQRELEEKAARIGGPILIADTDAFATGIWQERYCGFRSPEVDAISEAQRPDLYLLTHHEDVPFVQDGLRDGEKIRAWMTERFAQRLTETGRRWARIRGDRATRKREAILKIDELSAEGWRLADPLLPRVKR